MKKSVSLLAIFIATCALVSAGPEPIPETKNLVEQVAPPCHTWTGWYVGGFGGYKYGVIDTSLDPNREWEAFPSSREQLVNAAPDDLDTSGAELGGLIGFNWQFHNCWVVGLEVEGGYLWLRNAEGTEAFAVPSGFSDKSIQTSFKTHYLMTVAPRLGYAMGRWLPYVTGGLAVGDLDFSQRLHNVRPNGGYRAAGSASETNVGWMAGGGLQYALTRNWSVRAQYQYIDLGSIGFQAPGDPSVFAAFSTHNDAQLIEHNASMAVIFGF